MSIATEYIVRTKYETVDKSSANVGKIGSSADKASRSIDQLKRGAMLVGGAFLGGKAFQLGKKSLIDFNANLQDSKTTMAGLLMMNMGGTFASNQEKANSLVGRFQERAKLTSATMSELTVMGEQVAANVTRSGGSMQNLEDITVGASIAAKALRRETGDAAREVGQMLDGTLEKVDVFGRALIEPMGFTTESFNKLSRSKRLETVLKALNQPAIKAMAKAQSQGFSGVMSTLRDNFEITIGKVGLPLMQAITAEVQKWNKWIDENPGKISAFAESASKMLVGGFNALRDAMKWLASNRELIMSLAKAALILKGGSMVGGLIGSTGSALAKLTDASGKAAGGLAGFASKLGTVTTVLAAVYAGGSAIADKALRDREDMIRDQARTAGVTDFFAGLGRGRYKEPGSAALASRVQDARDANMLQTSDFFGGTRVNKFALATSVGRGGEYTVAAARAQQLNVAVSEVYRASTQELIAEVQLLRYAQIDAANRSIAAFGNWGTAAMSLVDFARSVNDNSQRPGAKPPGTTIKIAKVEVSAKDPGRWIHDLDKEARKRSRVPTRPRTASRGGAF